MPQSPIFDSGTVIRFNHPPPLGLVWHEFGVLSLDQWVLGNGQVSISAIKLAYLREIQKRAHLNRDISQIPHGVLAYGLI